MLLHLAWASSHTLPPGDDARRAIDAVGAAAAGAVLGVPPASLRLTRRCPACGSRSHGRPEVVGHDVLVSLSRAVHGNVTTLVGAAVAPSPGVLGLGVDVEHVSATADRVDGIVAGVAALSSDPLHAWVRAEAMLKATGRGLAGEAVAVPPAGHPGPWVLEDVELGPELVCAVAVEGVAQVGRIQVAGSGGNASWSSQRDSSSSTD